MLAVMLDRLCGRGRPAKGERVATLKGVAANPFGERRS